MYLPVNADHYFLAACNGAKGELAQSALNHSYNSVLS